MGAERQYGPRPGYRKKRAADSRLIDMVDVFMPPLVFDTLAVRLDEGARRCRSASPRSFYTGNAYAWSKV